MDSPLIGFHPPVAEEVEPGEIDATAQLEVMRAAVADGDPATKQPPPDWFDENAPNNMASEGVSGSTIQKVGFWVIACLLALAGIAYGVKKYWDSLRVYHFPQVINRDRFSAPYSGGNNARITFRKRRSFQTPPQSPQE